MWQKFVATADKHNDPGKFTTLYAYEWTSIPNGANMHRNVFFKDKPAAAPFSSFDSVLPEDLWTYLEIQRNLGRRLQLRQGRRDQALHNRQTNEAQDRL